MKARAALLAAHGFVVLNLYYFGHSSLPERFVGVPLEYFDGAVSWLKTHEDVDSERLGVIGHSRGAEAALLLGTIRPDIKVIVAVAPTAVVWPGPNPRDSFHSAWAHQDRELAFVPIDLVQGFNSLLRNVGGKEIDDRKLFERSLKNQSAVKRAAIPVEKSQAAILLISGKEDRVWPSAAMAEMLVERLDRYKHPLPYRHLAYEDAGHSFGLPNLPQPPRPRNEFRPGETRMGNAAAALESWKATLTFLESELPISP